jgi:regulator of sirC expression with transglutaminase-like and TPR domain
MTPRQAVVERFASFAAGPEPDLFEGALLVAELVDPGEDVSLARRRVEGLAARVRGPAGSEAPGLESLRRVLFAEEGFRGDTETYDDPRNSSVAWVLATGRGMPITLSIVVLEVGRLAGVPLAGVGLPGHFVVGGEALPTGRYLDAFDGGEITDAQALERRVGSIFGTPVELPAEAFLPDSPRAILERALHNLRRSWEKRGLFEEALAALDCSEALDPRDASIQRERGVLLLRAGRTQDAVAILEAYAERLDVEDAGAVRQLLEVVSDRSGGSSASPERKVFTLREAREALPRVREITERFVARYQALPDDAEEQQQEIVGEWIRQVTDLGIEVKGLWLVDFDSGAGYYCWKYPEPSLDYFHGYEEGFAGRLPLQ